MWLSIDRGRRVAKVLKHIINDSETANVAGLHDIHLMIDKFRKFGGEEIYERMDYEQCVEIEVSAIRSATEYKAETRDLKIDVFGDPFVSRLSMGVAKFVIRFIPI